ETVGIPFEARPADVEEEAAGDPRWVAELNARRKALAAAADLAASGEAGRLGLGGGSAGGVEREILGKPRGGRPARRFRARPAGRDHEVVGGSAVIDGGIVSGVEVTTVRFRTLDDATIDWYVGRGEWRGRAGGYAIQGAGGALVAAIEGDYLNVV